MPAGHIGTLFLDAKCKLLRYTPAIGRLFKLRVSDIGKSLSPLSETTDIPLFEEDAKRVQRTKETVQVEVPSPSGHLLVMDICPYRFLDDDQEGLSVAVSLVTPKLDKERMRSSSYPATRTFALLEGQEGFNTLFESAPDAIYVFDRHGYLMDANRMASRLSGGEISSIEGIHISQFVPPGRRDMIVNDFRLILEGKSIPSRPYEWLDREKSIPVEIRTAQITYRTAPCLAFFVRDISERRQLEKQVLHISEYERQRIGCDLHDRLTSQLSGATMLCRGLMNRLDTEKTIYSEDLAELVEILRDSTRQARALSKGLMPVRPESGGLADSFRDLCAKSSILFSGTIHDHITESLPDIELDVASQLFLIGSEAIHNAIKSAEADNINVILTSEGNDLAVVVSDDGIGFSADTWHGDGLGLRIIRHRAELIGAELDVSSEPGEGTTVACRVSLPVR